MLYQSVHSFFHSTVEDDLFLLSATNQNSTPNYCVTRRVSFATWSDIPSVSFALLLRLCFLVPAESQFLELQQHPNCIFYENNPHFCFSSSVPQVRILRFECECVSVYLFSVYFVIIFLTVILQGESHRARW